MEFSKRVLIIDNERSVVGVLLEFFARFQHRHTYDVVAAYSAAESLDILLRKAFDLILLDMVIPGIGARRKQGLDLLKRIRDLGVNTPALMMSGAWDTQMEARRLWLGLSVICASRSIYVSWTVPSLSLSALMRPVVECSPADTVDREMSDTDARLWHPWLRISRVLRTMLHTRWSAEAWPQVRVEFRKALALRSQIRRAGWFN
jgi:CheY-like chemotaxis protein